MPDEESMLIGHNRKAVEAGSASRKEARATFVWLAKVVISLILLAYGVAWLLTADDQDIGNLVTPGRMIALGSLIFLFGLFAEGSLPKKWRSLPLIIGFLVFILGISYSGIGKWVARSYEKNIEQCLGQQNCQKRANLRNGDTVDNAIRVTSSGWLPAPTDKWRWYEFPPGRCLKFTGRDPYGHNFASQAENRNGARVGHNIGMSRVKRRALMSISGKKEEVYLDMWKKTPGRRC